MTDAPALITTPTLLATEPVLLARLPLHIPRDGMMTHLPPALEELYRALNTQRLTPAGPWFAHHTELPATHFHFDACVPLLSPIEPTGRVQPGVLPAMRIARALYRGPYTHLARAWSEFRAWLTAHNLSTTPEIIERYVVNPSDTPDPTQLQTELVWPLLQEAQN